MPPPSRMNDTAPVRQGLEDHLIKIQPPRLADIQPTYAGQVEADLEYPAIHGWYASFMHALGHGIGCIGLIPCCICCNPYRQVDQGKVGLVIRFGRFERAADPGLVKLNAMTETLTMVDVRIQTVEVPRQVCMTKDNITLNLTSVIYYRITSPHKATFGITNLKTALVERTQTTLRHVVGARVLQDVTERREEIAQSIHEIIGGVSTGWGVQVESILIKDIIFSDDLQDSLSKAAQAKRIGESKVISARAEVESARLMRQAADILSSAPAMQIRYLETMQSMAKTANSKVIFMPAPNEAINQRLSFLAENSGEGPSRHNPGSTMSDAGSNNNGFQRAINARVIEDI